MAARQPESQLVFSIKRTIEAMYPSALVQKNHGSPYSGTGVPDLYVWVEGKTFVLEVKRQRPGESLDAARARCSPMQCLWLAKFRRAGVGADCVLSPAEAVAVLTGHPPFLRLDSHGRPQFNSDPESA